MYLDQHNDDRSHDLPNGSAVRRFSTREDAMQRTYDKRLYFRVTAGLEAAIGERARQSEMSVAEFCRAAVRDAVKARAA